MTQAEAFKRSMDSNPGWGTYIHLCEVFRESGASRTEIKKAFIYYMPKDEYDKDEVGEMIDYLLKIATEVPE